jgi:hypothetical protein
MTYDEVDAPGQLTKYDGQISPYFGLGISGAMIAGAGLFLYSFLNAAPVDRNLLTHSQANYSDTGLMANVLKRKAKNNGLESLTGGSMDTQAIPSTAPALNSSNTFTLLSGQEVKPTRERSPRTRGERMGWKSLRRVIGFNSRPRSGSLKQTIITFLNPLS